MFHWLNCVILNEESAEYEYLKMYFSASKRGGAVIRGGAIFGGNTVHL